MCAIVLCASVVIVLCASVVILMALLVFAYNVSYSKIVADCQLEFGGQVETYTLSNCLSGGRVLLGFYAARIAGLFYIIVGGLAAPLLWQFYRARRTSFDTRGVNIDRCQCWPSVLNVCGDLGRRPSGADSGLSLSAVSSHRSIWVERGWTQGTQRGCWGRGLMNLARLW
jgi:hypothetical protein